MKKVIVIVVALSLALCASGVWAQGGGGPGYGRNGGAGRGPMGPMGRMGPMGGGMMMSNPAMATNPPPAMMLDNNADALQLTEDQKTQAKDLLTKSEQARVPLMQKSAQACQALRAALVASQYDAGKVKQLAKDAQAAEAAVVDANIGTWTQLRSILNADQISKLQGVMQMRGPRPGGPPPGGAPAPGMDQAPPPPAP